MKIAIFSDNFFPEISGISDSIIALAKNYSTNGHIVRIYAPYHPPKNFKIVNEKFEEINIGENISIYRINSLPFPAGTKQARFVFPFGLSLFDIKKFKPDIIHTQHFFGTGLQALLATKILHIPLLGTNHTTITAFAPFNGKLLSKVMLKYVNWYYNQCNWVTTPSQTLLDEMKHWGLKTSASVMSNPIDLNIFKPVTPEQKQILRVKHNFQENIIIYSGRLSPEKNLDVLIKSLTVVKKDLGNFTLVIAGHGSSETQLKNLINKLDLVEQVIFLGTLNKIDLAEIYQASDIFVSASKSENQPLSLMQAYASGLPAVGVKAKGLGEYITSTTGFAVEPDNYTELGKKILYLLTDNELQKKLSLQVLTYVNEFSAEPVCKKWLELYFKLIKEYNDSSTN